MAERRDITRRQLLGGTAAAMTGICASRAGARSANSPVSRNAPALSAFDYRQVQLAPSLLERQFQENHRLLLELSEDSLLRPFRIREGLPAPGKDLGGWYDAYGFAPAGTFGQWLSALARSYAATSDEATRAKVKRLVQGYAATIEPNGRFYVENRFPAYIYDKLVCGLIDAHAFAHDPIALSVLARATDAVLPYLPPKAVPRQETPVRNREDFTRHCWDESYTLPENLFLASRRSGDARYRELAKRFLYDEYFDPLARGENVLPGKHAYSHLNALSSAAQAYLQLGDRKYLNAVKNGFAMVQQQSFSTGGWGPDEHFISPGSGKLGASLTTTHSSFETPCGSYGQFKITRYLMSITKDSRYGDSMERVLYNAILGAKPIQPNGSAFYYSDYNFQGHKFFHPDRWPCCSGTLPQIAADYRISAYFRDPRGVYVNLYVPSTLTWQRGGAECALRQTTEYPYDSQIRFDLATSAPGAFSIFLRIPAWAAGATLTVNGRRGSQHLTAGTFAEVHREWKTGDRMELELPLAMRLETVDPQHAGTVALLSGPLVLMTLLDSSPPPLTRRILLSARQTSAKAHVWNIPGSADLRLKSFMDIHEEQYRTYLQIQDA